MLRENVLGKMRLNDENEKKLLKNNVIKMHLRRRNIFQLDFITVMKIKPCIKLRL